jgi:hypothetical protein
MLLESGFGQGKDLYERLLVEATCTNTLSCRFLSRAGSIKLDGDEKTLTAEFKPSSTIDKS